MKIACFILPYREGAGFELSYFPRFYRHVKPWGDERERLGFYHYCCGWGCFYVCTDILLLALAIRRIFFYFLLVGNWLVFDVLEMSALGMEIVTRGGSFVNKNDTVLTIPVSRSVGGGDVGVTIFGRRRYYMERSTWLDMECFSGCVVVGKLRCGRELLQSRLMRIWLSVCKRCNPWYTREVISQVS